MKMKLRCAIREVASGALIATLLASIAGCGSSSDNESASTSVPLPPPQTPAQAPTPNPTPTPTPTPAPIPSSGLLFMDDFEYNVGRSDANAVTLFQLHGWNYAKSMQSSPGANGYLYTSSNVPGVSVPPPGRNSSRVLAIESLAQQQGGQTDFYLQYGLGEEVSYDNFIPGDVWIQFWIYPLRAGSQQTGFHTREKFIYPCAGPYPCQTGKWIWMLGNTSYPPQFIPAPAGSAFAVSRDNQVGTITNSNTDVDNQTKLGQTNTMETIAANRWTLVKIHYNTSSANGVYECWLRARNSTWVKVAEWVGGVTPGFAWTIPVQNQGGHRVLRMPTTMPANATTPTENAWLYMDDFAIAASEAALPTYLE